jgi:SAM-dependent methyltransferase
MTPPGHLRDALADGLAPRQVEDGIYSVLPVDAGPHPYDSWAALYDLVVGSRPYNRLVWGCSPREYGRFAEQAVRSADGCFLEAGCGSLVFAAGAYARAERPLILMDQSLGMLRRARQRLIEEAGRVPGHVALLQADLRAVPFRPAAFRTILSLNVLHLVPDVPAMLRPLARCLAPGGGFYATSLVLSGSRRDRAMRFYHRTGEFAPPRTPAEFADTLEQALDAAPAVRVAGSMAFAVAGGRADPS